MTADINKRIKAIRAGKVPAGYKKTILGIIPEDWDVVRFRDRFTRVTRKNTEGNSNVLTISAQYGLINQNEFFNKTVASDDKSNYFLLSKGEFAYNKSYSNGYPFGALKRLEYYDKGVVSPLYICFAANELNKQPDYYVQYFEAGLMNREIQAFAQEGARNHGLLNISVDDFFNSNLICPPIDEQQKIADILTTQDKIIEQKERIIAERKIQKSILTEQLISGKKRLSGYNNPWKNISLRDCCYTDGQYGLNTPACEYKDGLPKYIRITDITEDGRYDLNSKAYANVDGYDDYILKNDDILLVRTGSTTGKSYLYNEKDGELVYAGFLIRFSINPQIIDSKFVASALNTTEYWKWVRVMSKRSGQPGINSTEYSRYEFKIPGDVKESQAIAKVLSTAADEITLLQKDLEQEKLKKKSLMQLLLTGIVRVSA
ncbi:type I restriction enzyme, S subunit [Fibrobacter sp. UWH9]|uniref:restriction endonuclease subunit S n=1 Tax=Fibrobacter sp. UWH9 TaxID=1896213 RepID=UPI00091455DD|nr:restriction endonuclease subunit S [Fibrobacter sp. UWH9]SHH70609.1 type I restriction enzyme, S subunit [Fibrobacter sp. UWH9]